MPVILWTPKMTETLLGHLEANKGDQGLYVTDRQAACKEVAALLTDLPGSKPINCRQVNNKFQMLFYRYRNQNYTCMDQLFSLGRIVVSVPSNRRGSGKGDNDVWTLSDDHSSSDDRASQRPPRRPTRKRPSLETPASPLRKKPKCDTTSTAQTIPSSSKAKSLVITLPADTLSSPKVVSPVRDDLHPPPPTNNDEIDESLSHSLPQPSTAASSSTGTLFNDNGNREAEIAVREYLVQDARAFIPSQKDLFEQKRLITDQIFSLVSTLGQSSRPTDAHPSQHLAATRYDRTPRFYEALEQQDFADLCMRLYGITTKDELRDKITGAKVCLKVFLNAFLAVAVFVWVFDEGHVSVPEMLEQETSFPAIEGHIKKLSPKLYEQLLRESRSSYVKDDKNFEPYVGELSRRLHETLKPFLECNNILPVHEDYNSWLLGLKTLFLGALKFKAQITLLSGRHLFRFPHADTPFDPQTMDTESRDIKEGPNRVECGLFPAVIQTSEPMTITDVPPKKTLFKATVMLQ